MAGKTLLCEVNHFGSLQRGSKQIKSRKKLDITRITPENSEYFEGLAPERGFEDEELVWLGAAAEDGAACAVLGGGIHEGMGFIDWIYTAPEYREK